MLLSMIISLSVLSIGPYLVMTGLGDKGVREPSAAAADPTSGTVDHSIV